MNLTLLNGKLLIDSTPLTDAEDYLDFKIHPRNHCTVWGMLQRAGTVLPEMEYEEPPRGRVVYNTKTRQFTLLADRRILSKKALVRKIRSNAQRHKNVHGRALQVFPLLGRFRAVTPVRSSPN